jgi:hypothetical protein
MKTTLPLPSPGGGWGVVSKIAADVIWEKQKSEKGKEGKCERKKIYKKKRLMKKGKVNPKRGKKGKGFKE